MHPVPSFRTAALALLLAGGSQILAQVPSRPADLPSLQRDAVALHQGERGLAGFGPDYSVRFDGVGMTFVPALGRRAAQTQDLVITLDSVQRGDAPMPFERHVPPQRSGLVASYRRSPSLSERYEVRPEGVEQSFLFAELPGAGDLVVRCRLGGSLAERGQGGADGTDRLQFLVPGLGGVFVGGVTGIDANGARCRGGLRFVGGCLELSLPGAFVDAAALPLLLDPLVSARLDFGPGPAGDSELDAAYDATTGDWLVAWTRVLSATSSELRGRHYHQTTGLGTGFLMASGPVLRRPRVANHNAVDRFVVVFEAADSMIGLSTVKAQVVNADRTLGPAVNVTDGTSRCIEADVSGNSGAGTGASSGLVAFHEVGTGIRLLTYSLASGNAGALTLGTTQVLAAEPVGPPRLARSAGVRTVVAYGRSGQLATQVVTRLGQTVGPVQIVPTGGTAVPNVAVDGDDIRFLAAFEQEIAPGDRDIRCVQWNWNGNGITQAGYDAISQEPNVDEFAPAVALLGPKFLVLWSETAGFLVNRVQGKPLAFEGCTQCGVEFTLAGNLASNTAPAIASCRAGGGANSDALLLLSSRAALPPFQGDVVGWRFTPFSASTSMPLWNGCGAPVTLQVQGSFALGNSSFGLRVGSSDPSAALGLVSFGLGGAALQCQGCSFVQPVSSTFLPVVGGQATYSMSVPCNVGLLGLPLDVQGAVIGSASNFCPLMPQLSTSPASRLTLVE